MLKIKLITFVLFFALINNVFAEVVNKIEIKGNKRISTERKAIKYNPNLDE